MLVLGFTAKIASAEVGEAGAPSVKFTTLHSFTGVDGWYPESGLVQATNGDLCGTTENDRPGTIFKITPNGALTTLYTFCTQSGCADGASPPGALVQATNGDLYGLTAVGGVNISRDPSGAGTVFKITPSGTLTTAYSFCSQAGCADGIYPVTALVQAANGDLYGTTYQGGAHGGGTIFRITPSGTLTTLHSFCSQNACADGEFPYAGLVQARNGDLYGTTSGGGSSSNCAAGPLGPGCGTVFKITPSGILTTLYSFCSQNGCTDGADPSALIQATNGDLYGTTAYGGANCPTTTFIPGCGTVFKVTPTGALTTLYSFCAKTGCSDGENPEVGLVQGTYGDLYGTTFAGGTGGTIFKITPAGTLTTLHTFCLQTGCPDGAFPNRLIQGTNGILYGTTYQGGASACTAGCGTIFAFSTGQAPFVETRPTIGKVGEAVTILGYKLTGATSVTFNRVPATFTVDASTEITTTVPVGATTGTVQVLTPSGTVSSNKAFEVAP